MYPGVEDIYRRFKDDAVFLGVYVREAHPTDGWKMESNAKVGVTVAQPKTFAERTDVAQQCHRLLKPSIPLLVDEIDAGLHYTVMQEMWQFLYQCAKKYAWALPGRCGIGLGLRRRCHCTCFRRGRGTWCRWRY